MWLQLALYLVSADVLAHLFQLMGAALQEPGLGMLSSLLAVLFGLTDLEPTQFPGAGWRWEGAVSVVSMSRCPAVARADSSCVWV